MRLPEEDEDYLREKGLPWQIVPCGDGGCLVLPGYLVRGDRYDRDRTDLMIRIPGQYNNAGLDMFYVDPPLRLRAGGYPPAAEVFEDPIGRRWQRFSRHRPTPWRAGIDGLPSFLALAHRELNGQG
jgi:hypothetical protein